MNKAQMLKMIMRHLGFSNNSELARYLGVESSVVSNWINRETFKAELIFTKCEEWINPAWLLSGGKGSMLKDTQTAINRSLEKSLKEILKPDFIEGVRNFPCICVTDCEGRITYINDNYERQTGYAIDEVTGKKPGEVMQRNDFKRTNKERLRSLIKKGEPFYTEIYPNYTRSGYKVKCKIHIIPLVNNGKVTSYVSFADFIPGN